MQMPRRKRPPTLPGCQKVGSPFRYGLSLGKGTHSPARSRIWRNNSAERRMPPRCSSSRSGRTAGIRPSVFATNKASSGNKLNVLSLIL